MAGTAIAAAIIGSATTAWATNYAISITSDGFLVNGNCTLREALYAASTNAAYDTCTAGSTALDTITLTTSGGTYAFGHGQHVIGVGGGPLLIQGPARGLANATVDMALANRFIHTNPGADELTIRDLVLTRGHVTSGSGGVIAALDSCLNLDSVVITGSSAIATGGAVEFESDDGSGDSLNIQGCLFSGNSVQGVSPAGGAVMAETSAGGSIRITDSTFQGNSGVATADYGGTSGGLGINAFEQAQVSVIRTVFQDNIASAVMDQSSSGAGMHIYLDGNATAAVRDTSFIDNLADVPAGATSPQVCGAGFYVRGASSLTLDRVVFDGNQAPNVQTGSIASHQVDVRSRDTAAATIRNVLIVNGRMGLVGTTYVSGQLTLAFITAADNEFGMKLSDNDSGVTALFNSVFWNNLSYDLTADGSVETADNLVGVNPLFVDPAAGDYRLQAGSPAVDTADPAHPGLAFCDLDHAPRTAGSAPDKGCYERDGIFADDLEDGDTGAWSSTTS